MTPEKSWILHTNVYEVNLRQYTHEGTINAFRPHLARLRDMGVETLWFMPITPIAQKEKKGSMGSYYACSDYTAVSPEFGSLEDFRALVEEAHGLGFRVILDWVANHTGWDHRWTWEHPEWFERNGATGDFVRAHGMDDIIELDFNNPDMRRALIDAMRWWVEETGIDGFRCDLAFWVGLDFWVEAKAALDAVRPLFWLGELDPLTHPEYMQVFDAAYTWSWMHSAQEYYHGRTPLQDLYALLERYRTAPGLPAWFTANHDENSWNGTEFEKYGAAAPLLAVFSCTWPGIPLLYSGQELPNERRLQFFEKDPIGWTQEAPQFHRFYQLLLQLKSAHPALAADAGCTVLETNAGKGVLAFLRQAGNDEVLVLLNLTGRLQDLALAAPLTGAWRELFNGARWSTAEPGQLLPPWGFAVYTRG
ncbi:alpha-amylase family glycosyl hydrolase [Flaviaesturariibacter amylovorans]|uniref:Alpha-amylase family glycosyl hydrolase n=1 Tax=Flaviaesturariibacter amylovorans TaxID=1084520 RepID=A0ABP8GGK2_9BACT